MMPVKKSLKLATADRRRHVAELYVQGQTQVAIAEQLGVTQPTICEDLKKIHKQWRESAIRDFDAARELELQKLDRIEREAWDAWERSKKPAQSAVVTGQGTAGERVRKSLKNQHGDPRFLEMVHKCISSRRALLGLDAPMQIAPVMPDGSEPYRLAIDELSHDELRAIKRLRDRSRVIEGKVIDAASPHA